MSIEEHVKQVFVSGGVTYVKHSSNGDKFYVCSNNILKIFSVKDSEQEPDVIDVLSKISSFEIHSTQSKSYALITSKTGECESFDLNNLKSMGKLMRSPLSLRDAVFTHAGSMVLCGGDDGELSLINLDGTTPVKKLDTKDQINAISYNNVGDLAAVSMASGDLIIYSYSSPDPRIEHTFNKILVEKNADDDQDEDELDDEINFDDDDDTLNKPKSDNESSLIGTKPDWHPNGELIAIPTKTREIHVYNRGNFNDLKFKFKGYIHEKPIIDLKWSPNGKYLASISLDNKFVIWDTFNKKSIKIVNLPMTACSLSWGKSINGIDYDVIVGTNSGHIVKFDSIVKQSSTGSSSMLDDEAEESEVQNNNEGEGEDNEAGEDEDEDEDDMTGLFGDAGEDDFIVDDDGNGYAEINNNTNGKKRPILGSTTNGFNKQRKVESSQSVRFSAVLNNEIKPFSPGATPWSNDRRYITINSIGYVWAVKQDNYNTITVSFFDRGLHKEYYFRDLYKFSVASMNQDGVVFAASSLSKGGTIMYKSHDQQTQWIKTIPLQINEIISSIALSKTTIAVATSFGMIRRYSLFGRVERLERTAPVVACVNNDKYLFTVTKNCPNSPLSFNLQDHDGKYFQRNEHLPIPSSSSSSNSINKHPIKGLFFSLDGDPCIVGNDDYLLVLSRWRDPLQASWIPMLDTVEGVKKISAGDNVSCWPLGFSKEMFNFVVVRGSHYPSFPLALPAEIPVRLPLSKRTPSTKKSKGDDEEEEEEEKEEEEGEVEDDPEEQLVRYIALGELLNDAIINDDVLDETAEERLTEISVLYDHSLLKQFGGACNDGNIMDALYLATKMREDRALMAASKIAERLGFAHLVRKLTKLRESRMEFD